METKTAAHTDLTFFTNEPGASLLDRFKKTLEQAQLFDILVGYFRMSGFHALHEAFEPIEKIRILVGLNLDRTSAELATASTDGQVAANFASHAEARKEIHERIIKEADYSDDSESVEEGIRRFIEFLDAGKMEIRVYPSADIHAKVYIARFGPGDRDYGRVITGSSNFSAHGLVAQREFNVELKQRTDVEFAQKQFNRLWEEAVDVTDEYVETVQKETWLRDDILPYELYLKFLYEYLQEDINLDSEEQKEGYLPEGFLNLEYQRQAVAAANRILDTHGGVFVADVVGLGKTYIAAMLANKLAGRCLVICPPVLQEYWEEVFADFGVRGPKFESLGKLEHILRSDHEKYQYVIVDEAHRFRNEDTQRYEMLYEVCNGKKVILVSATPLNNTPRDLLSLLKLFQVPRRSSIPGVPDLQGFFGSLDSAWAKVKKGEPSDLGGEKDISAHMRDKVLQHVMIRRTRNEIAKYFEDDLAKQGVSFPDIDTPHRIVYAFDKEIEAVFERTIDRFGQLSYARYAPLLDLKKPLDDLRKQGQVNLRGFIKSILVKRLESSFHAFKQTIGRFIESSESFLGMVDEGTVYVGTDVDVLDLIEQDSFDKLNRLIEEEKVTEYDVDDFNPSLFDKIRKDLEILQAIQADWEPITQDPKLDAFVAELEENPNLKDKKLLIFTEAAETGAYLADELDARFPGDVISYSGGSKQANRDTIKENFDPTWHDPKNDYRILVSTDVLAEGINLHRSNVVVNYDLPWNPTRVLQRVGRVNRVGTKYDTIHIFNFFPTEQSDVHLGQEKNIKAKIQIFINTLGNDAQYLSDEEEISSHELFGETLYEKLNDPETFAGEAEEGPSELKYLSLLREIRDEDPNLFDRIKRLPKKARTCREAPDGGDNRLLTFFRKNKLKKFFVSDARESTDLNFFDAAALFECEPDTKRKPLPGDVYELLERNKARFESTLAGEDIGQRRSGGRSNEQTVIMRLKDPVIRKCPRYTDIDHDFMRDALEAFKLGTVPRNTTKRIKDAIEYEKDPLKVLAVVREEVKASFIEKARRADDTSQGRREVILSEYLLAP